MRGACSFPKNHVPEIGVFLRQLRQTFRTDAIRGVAFREILASVLPPFLRDEAGLVGSDSVQPLVALGLGEYSEKGVVADFVVQNVVELGLGGKFEKHDHVEFFVLVIQPLGARGRGLVLEHGQIGGQSAVGIVADGLDARVVPLGQAAHSLDDLIFADDILTVEIGDEQVIEGMEEGLIGLEAGETDTLTIPPEKAYGEPSDDQVQEFATEELREMLGGQTPEEGAYLEAQNGRQGEVVHVDEEVVRVDFNPALAGETLTFDVEIVDVN